MRIFVAGHNGMVGGAILRRLAQVPHHDVLTADRATLDLTDQSAVRQFMQRMRPDAVILAAARVGGIWANQTYPAQFIHDNLMIATNVIHQAYMAEVPLLLNLGSSCIYPRGAPQPMREDALLTGPLEPTNAPYAIAKIAAIKLCESYNRQYGTDYRSIMPTNLFGPGDNFHPENAHVIPALIARFTQAVRDGAPELRVWGSGTPRREFLHVDDLADAALFVLGLSQDSYQAATAPRQSHINVGVGKDIAIRKLAQMIAEITGYKGTIICDPSKPDGAPRKLLDITRLTGLGWAAQIDLRSGLRETIDWYQRQAASGLRVPCPLPAH